MRDVQISIKHFNNEAASLVCRVVAGIPLVEAGGFRDIFDSAVREDFTDVVLGSARRAGDITPRLGFALIGGEPYSRWI